MYKLTYRNVPNNIKVEEYCFWQKQEARRLFIDEEGDLELISCEYLHPFPIWSLDFWKYFWLCFTNYTVQKDWEKK